MSVDKELMEIFSHPETETIEGVLAAGGKLSPALLIHAYENGVFPWPHHGYPLLWFCPDQRGVMDFSELHLARSFLKWQKQKGAQYRVTMNENFAEVVRHCRLQKRQGQQGSWINNEIEKNYFRLYEMGKAISVEIMRGAELVGGIYGVQSTRYFSCESMFHKEDNTSKLAFVALTQYLQTQGQSWMDIQMVTPVCASFGGKLIAKSEFLRRIGK